METSKYYYEKKMLSESTTNSKRKHEQYWGPGGDGWCGVQWIFYWKLSSSLKPEDCLKNKME